MRTTLLAIASFAGCLFCAIAALMLVNFLPNAVIEENLLRTSTPANFTPHPLFSGTKMDWWTECELMTAGIYRKIDSDAQIRSFDYRDGYNEKITSEPVSRAWRSTVLSPNIGNCELLHGEVGGKLYFRYWMGGQVFTRPLLYLSGVGAVRVFVAVLFLTSLVRFLLSVKHNGGSSLAVATIALIAITPLFSQVLILPHASAWIIGFAASSLIMKWGKLSNHGAVLLGLWSGMILAFFDLLNNPIVVPMALTFGYFLTCYAKAQAPSVVTLVLLNLAWLAGYAGFWSAKWVLAVTELGPDAVIANITGKFSERANLGAGPEFSWSDSLYYNGLSMIAPIVGFAGLALRQAMSGSANHRDRSQRALLNSSTISFTALPLAFGTLPVLWIIALGNHSAVHHFFVAPILVWSLLLWFFAIYAATEPDKELHRNSMDTTVRTIA